MDIHPCGSLSLFVACRIEAVYWSSLWESCALPVELYDLGSHSLTTTWRLASNAIWCFLQKRILLPANRTDTSSPLPITLGQATIDSSRIFFYLFCCLCRTVLQMNKGRGQGRRLTLPYRINWMAARRQTCIFGMVQAHVQILIHNAPLLAQMQYGRIHCPPSTLNFEILRIIRENFFYTQPHRRRLDKCNILLEAL
jgi:hypothetical protein